METCINQPISITHNIFKTFDAIPTRSFAILTENANVLLDKVTSPQ